MRATTEYSLNLPEKYALTLKLLIYSVCAVYTVYAVLTLQLSQTNVVNAYAHAQTCGQFTVPIPVPSPVSVPVERAKAANPAASRDKMLVWDLGFKRPTHQDTKGGNMTVPKTCGMGGE